MRLEEYLEATGETQAEFGKRSGVPQVTISRISLGDGSCNSLTAIRIVKASEDRPTEDGEAVRYEDLAPPDWVA